MMKHLDNVVQTFASAKFYCMTGHVLMSLILSQQFFLFLCFIRNDNESEPKINLINQVNQSARTTVVTSNHRTMLELWTRFIPK